MYIHSTAVSVREYMWCPLRQKTRMYLSQTLRNINCNRVKRAKLQERWRKEEICMCIRRCMFTERCIGDKKKWSASLSETWNVSLCRRLTGHIESFSESAQDTFWRMKEKDSESSRKKEKLGGRWVLILEPIRGDALVIGEEHLVRHLREDKSNSRTLGCVPISFASANDVTARNIKIC